MTPYEDLPPGSSGGAGEGRNFPRSMDPDPDDLPNCTYCGKDTVKSPNSCPNRYNNDHIIPKSRGGNNSPDNQTPACQDCNLSKGNKMNDEWYRLLYERSGERY